MRSRRFACFLLGMWLAGGFFMAWVAAQNFRSVDRLLERANPAAAVEFQRIGRDNVRTLLRYEVSEQNRYYFEHWETIQMMLGAGFFLYLLFGTRQGKYSLLAALLMLAVTAGQRFFLTPEVISVGRSMDFVPPASRGSADRRFHLLHQGYVAAELAKLGLGVTLAATLLTGRRQTSTQDVREQLNLINKANYRHIDG